MDIRYSEFTTLISSINKNIQKIKNIEMFEFGLKGNQVQCLYFLFNEPNGISSSKLCKLCGEDKAAISRTIADLENKGLVSQESSSEKKYKNPITLTQKGKDVGILINDKIQEIWNLSSYNINDQERKYLYSSLHKIDKNLQSVFVRYKEK